MANQTGNANLVWKKDGNGVPGWRTDSNTTYSNATTSTAGLMSASDKSILTWRTGNGTRISGSIDSSAGWCSWCSFGKITIVSANSKLTAGTSAWGTPIYMWSNLPKAQYGFAFPATLDGSSDCQAMFAITTGDTKLNIQPRGKTVTAGQTYYGTVVYFRE